MQHPLQCLALAAKPDDYILVAAAASSISTYRLSDGALLATWSPPSVTRNGNKEVEKKGTRTISKPLKDDTEPADKRRKLSHYGERSETSATDTAVEVPTCGAGSLMASKPVVTKLAITSNAKNVIAVTGDDKCIRVLDLLEDGTLLQRSERQMPKRPCAITVTPDNATILCADKFGDVYSLPLLGQNFAIDNRVDIASETLSREPSGAPGKRVPAASMLTVHTKKNQEALRNQLKLTDHGAEEKTCDFEHHLLLGHVSLLTDMAYVSLGARPALEQRPQSHILTSDRDEHIRISRGMPQAHIIEGYCLGHTEFISKIIVPYWHQDVLISGGGDNYLIVWDWLAGRALHKIDLTMPYHHWRDSLGANSDKSAGSRSSVGNKLAVSGMWVLKSQHLSEHESEGEVVVAFEGIPALFHWSLRTDGAMNYRRFYALSGNVVDAVVLEYRASIIVSVDNVHEPGSTKIVRSRSSQEALVRLHALSFATDLEGEPEVRDTGLVSVSEKISSYSTSTSDVNEYEGASHHRALSDLLYSVEQLRKRSPEQ